MLIDQYAKKRMRVMTESQAKQHYREDFIRTHGYPFCEKCGRSNCSMSIHHRVFKSRGGKNNDSNFILLCAVCHGAEHGIRVKI